MQSRGDLPLYYHQKYGKHTFAKFHFTPPIFCHVPVIQILILQLLKRQFLSIPPNMMTTNNSSYMVTITIVLNVIQLYTRMVTHLLIASHCPSNCWMTLWYPVSPGNHHGWARRLGSLWSDRCHRDGKWPNDTPSAYNTCA